MKKRAITLFASSILLFGCSSKMIHPTPISQPPDEPPPSSYELAIPDPLWIEEKAESIKRQEIEPVADSQEKMASTSGPPVPSKLFPDVTLTNLSLNPKGRLVVAFANIGDSPLPMGAGNLKIFIDGQLKGIYPLNTLSDQPFLQPKGDLTFTTPFTIVGRHDIDAHLDINPEAIESNQENNQLKKTLEGPPIGPDIVVKDLELTEDLELSVILSNAGEIDLRKGVTFHIRIFVNDWKVSEFDHFTSEALRANFGNSYAIDPPYRVGISGFSKVKISLSPRLPSDDIRLENNVLERTFIIFPFKIGPQAKEEFSFSISPFRPLVDSQTGKVKIEMRWEGGGSPLTLSFSGTGQIKSFPAISGKGPLKVEFRITSEELQKGSLWRIMVANHIGKRVEGQLIIQHP